MLVNMITFMQVSGCKHINLFGLTSSRKVKEDKRRCNTFLLALLPSSVECTTKCIHVGHVARGRLSAASFPLLRFAPQVIANFQFVAITTVMFLSPNKDDNGVGCQWRMLLFPMLGQTIIYVVNQWHNLLCLSPWVFQMGQFATEDGGIINYRTQAISGW